MIATNFEDKNISYAYSTMHDFFDQYDLWYALKEVEAVIKAASRNKSWQKDYPYRLIHFMKLLEELCGAALIVHESNSTRPGCIINEKKMPGYPDIIRPEQFVHCNSNATTWNCFPRHLSAGQYLNPYKALRKFSAYKSSSAWKKALSLLTEYALSNSCIDDELQVDRILSIRLHLMRLIEACHLLQVRSTLTKNNPDFHQNSNDHTI